MNNFSRVVCPKLRPIVQNKCNVATWTHLASAFNTKQSRKLNFSLVKENHGLFKIPELKDANGFYLLLQEAQNNADKLVAEVSDSKRTRKLVTVFDELSDTLCRVADMADCIRMCHPDQKTGMAAEEACMSIGALVEKLNTNITLYNSIKDVIDRGDIRSSLPYDSIDKHVAELFCFDFEQSGIHLPESKRKRFVELNENILMLGNQFMNGCHRPSSVPTKLLPENLRHCFTIDGDNVLVTGLYSDHHSDIIREAAYRIFLYPDDHQESRLCQLLQGRTEVAHLVGFKSYPERALRGTLAQTPEFVTSLLEKMSVKVRDSANKDFELLKKLKNRHGSTSHDLKPWDVAYFSGLARHEVCKINNSELAPYFSLGGCMEGLDLVFHSLFGVKLVHEEAEPGELWHHDVHKIAVMHDTDGCLGYIYCDFFERPSKAMVDCHYTIIGGREVSNVFYQLPVVVLNLNFPSPTATKPSLLTPGMVVNLFHEFGHAMHSMLGRTRYQHVTGTRCSTDFAEVPSVLMEYFASDPRVLAKFARHYKTGEPLDLKILESVCTAKNMFAASEKQLQLFYSILDQKLHSVDINGKSTIDLLSEMQDEHYQIQHIPGTAWHLRFQHLVGYGAKYYSYVLSTAVASKIWHQCFKNDPFNRDMGNKYYKEMLAHGGGRPPHELIANMLGEDFCLSNLVNSIEIEVSEAQENVKRIEKYF